MDQTPVVGIPAAADPDRDRPVAELPAPPAAAAQPGLPSQRLVRLAELAAAAGMGRHRGHPPMTELVFKGQVLAPIAVSISSISALRSLKDIVGRWCRSSVIIACCSGSGARA